MKASILIKPEHKRLLNQALATLFDNSNWLVNATVPQGASAAIYIIECNDKMLVARFSDPNRPTANIPHEYACQQQASNDGIAPRIYYSDIDSCLSIMEWIDSKSLPFFQAHQTTEAAMVGELIASLHQSKPFPESHSVFDLLMMVSQGLKNNFPDDSYLTQCIEIINPYLPLVNVADDKRPSHRDCHSFNLLFDGKRYFLIDWESAGNESLYFDLAVISNTLLFEDADQKAMLLAYFKQTPTAQQYAKFELMRIIAFVYYGVLLLYLSTTVPEPKLTVDETKKLPSYSFFIRQQVKSNNPDMTGYYLRYGYTMLQQAIELNESEAVSQACSILSIKK